MFQSTGETYTCKSNLVAEEVEALDARLGVMDVLELGKAKSTAAVSHEIALMGGHGRLTPCKRRWRYQ